MSMTKEHILRLLDSQKILYKLVEHEAVCTMEEIDALGLPNGERIAKNIFLHDNKSGRFFLLTMEKGKRMNWKQMRARPESKRADFASEDELRAVMGLSRGEVTPLGVLNDQACCVTVLLDTAFRNGLIGVHLNTNTATVWLQASDLFQIIKQHGNQVEWAVL